MEKNLENVGNDILWMIFKEIFGEKEEGQGQWNIVQVMSLRLTCQSFYDIIAHMKIPNYAERSSSLFAQTTRPWWTNQYLLGRVARANWLPSFLMTPAFMYNSSRLDATFRGQLISRSLEPGGPHDYNAIKVMIGAIEGGHEELALNVLAMDFRLTHAQIRMIYKETKDSSSLRWQTYLRSYCRCALCKATEFDGTLIINVDIDDHLVSPPISATFRYYRTASCHICDERMHDLAFHVKTIQFRVRDRNSLNKQPRPVSVCHSCSIKPENIYTISTSTLSPNQQLEFDRIIRERREQIEAKRRLEAEQAEKELTDAWKRKLASAGASIVAGYSDTIRPTRMVPFTGGFVVITRK